VDLICGLTDAVVFLQFEIFTYNKHYIVSAKAHKFGIY